MNSDAISNLKAFGLGDVLYTQGHDVYEARIASYRSLSCQLRPWAVVQPRNTEEVSKAVQAIVRSPGCKFAVRSGGNMACSGSNNIADGVTIDLGLMTEVTYDPRTQIAHLLPGATWTEVYTKLEKHGRMVAGGRVGTVGVGGFLTGGGLSFFTCRVGFACDQVANFEVVLADGSVVNANEETNPDLFQALKGVGNNFGIVTCFSMKTFAARNIWDCNIYASKECSFQIGETVSNFTKSLSDHPNDHILAMWNYQSTMKEHSMTIQLTNLDGQREPETLGGFLSIPGRKDAKTTTIATELSTHLNGLSYNDTWFTLTFKSDQRIILKAAEIFETFVSRMKIQMPDKRSTTMVLQPLLPLFAQHSLASGGNMLGLDGLIDDCLLLVWIIMVDPDDVVNDFGSLALRDCIKDIENFAESVEGSKNFRYMNYCDSSQDPIASYGMRNVRKMHDVAKKFDPDEVFQNRVPGGFKIPRIGATDSSPRLGGL